MAYITFQPSDHFNTKLWTGNATNSTAITGVGFQPDFVWIKNRSTTANHNLFDAIRGATYRLYSDNDSAQVQATDSLASFDSDGFTLNNGSPCNGSGNSVVGWNWKANGQGSSNTGGSINTTYTSANTTSGFSISQYTGNSTNGATIGHGLGVAPKMVIVKSLSNTTAWMVYHASLGNGQEIYLNGTNASSASTTWNSTTPTSTVVSLGGASGDGVNYSGDYVAYCFAEKKGFSKFGSYTGNGSNSSPPFVYTGFKPAFLMVKRTDASAHWQMTDNKISFNGVGSYGSNFLSPSQSNAEGNGYGFMLHSNGFAFSGSDSASATVNASGGTYIYMAFAESPIVSSNGVPATAK